MMSQWYSRRSYGNGKHKITVQQDLLCLGEILESKSEWEVKVCLK